MPQLAQPKREERMVIPPVGATVQPSAPRVEPPRMVIPPPQAEPAPVAPEAVPQAAERMVIPTTRQPGGFVSQPEAATTENFFTGLGGAATRSYANQNLAYTTLLWVLPGDAISTDELLENYRYNQQLLSGAAITPAYAESQQRVAEAEGFWQKAVAWLHSPEVFATRIAELAAQFPLTIAAGVGGGAVGGLPGAAVGIGSASALNAWGLRFWEYLGERGVDLNDELAVRAALSDPELVNDATWNAAQYSGTVGVFDAIGAGVGGRIASRVFTPTLSVTQRIGGVAGGATVDAIFGGLGEAAGQQISRGRIDPLDVFAEVALGLGASGVVDTLTAAAFAPRGGTPQTSAVDLLRTAAERAGVEVGPTQPRVPVRQALSVAEPQAPTFESAVEIALEQQNAPLKATPARWMNWLRAQTGVGENEIRARGLDVVVGGSREQSITREAIQEYLREVPLGLDVEVRPDTFSGTSYARQLSPDAPPYVGLPPGSNNRQMLITLPQDPARVFLSETHPVASDPSRVVVAWARTEDVTVNGERSLLVNEVQSELFQKRPEDIGADISALERQIAKERNVLEAAFGPESEGGWTGESLGRLDSLEQELVEAREAADAFRAQATLPMRDTWPSMTVAAVIQRAAREGYRRVIFPSGRFEDLVQGGGRNRGRAKFYDERIASTVRKRAKMSGLEVETVKLPVKTTPGLPFVREGGGVLTELDLLSVVLDPLAFAARPVRAALSQQLVYTIDSTTEPLAHATAERMRFAAEALAKKFRLSRPLEIYFHSGEGKDVVAGREVGLNGRAIDEGVAYVIDLFLDAPEMARHPAFVWSTFAHELGHIIMWDKWDGAPDDVKMAFEVFYQSLLNDARGGDKARALLRRDHAVLTHTLNHPIFPVRSIRETVDNLEVYWLMKEEVFAEQVAKWATTDEKPLTLLEKYLSAMAKTLRGIFDYVARVVGYDVLQPNEILAGWLNSFLETTGPFMKGVDARFAEKTRQSNARALRSAGSQVAADPMSPATIGLRSMLTKLFGNAVPPELAAMPAHVDSMNWFLQNFAAVWQVAKRNPRLAPLNRFREAMDMMGSKMQQLWARPLRVIKDAQQLGPGQTRAIADAFRDYMTFGYLSDEQYNNGVRRRPTQQEWLKLYAKHGVDPAAQEIVQRILVELDTTLDFELQTLRLEAVRNVTDEARLDEIFLNLAELERRKKSEPHFPTALRYGKFGVVAEDAAGNLLYVDMVGTRRKQAALIRAVEAEFAHIDGLKVGGLEFPKDVAPLMSVYPGLLRSIPQSDISAAQRRYLRYLAFDENPASLFRTRARLRETIDARNADFFRLLSSYFHHSARHLARIEWRPEVDKAVNELRELRDVVPEVAGKLDPTRDRYQQTQNKKLAQITDMVERAREYSFNTSRDYAAIKSLTFHWMLGFNVAGAALNLSQIPFFTYPFLASKFGDVRSASATIKALRRLKLMYTKQDLTDTNRADWRAYGKAGNMGLISEAMAAEFAALSEGRILEQGFGGNTAQKWLHFASQASAGMFHTSEKANRTVSWFAAWDLALRDPANAYVQEQVRLNPALHEELLREGFSEAEAAAFIAAKDAVEVTQGKYTKRDRPRAFRGAGGLLLVFKSFTQQMLMAMVNNKPMAARTIVLLTIAAGMMGVPFAQDFNDLIRALAYKLFGKDFNPEAELRKLLVDHLGMDVEESDLVLHGFGREGFGLPALFQALGVGFPEIDRSGAIGFGQVLPVTAQQLLGPQSGEPARVVASAQDIGGAALGQMFEVFNFLNEQVVFGGGWETVKLWERVAPRWAGNLLQMMRYGATGEEVSRTGAQVVEFDRTNPEHMGEIIATGLGYNPTRISRQWDRIIASREAEAYWDIRRTVLLGQLDQAVRVGDQEGVQAVMERIVEFNRTLPPQARTQALTRDVIRSSIGTRIRTRTRQEAGLPLANKDIPLWAEIQRLYPGESVVDLTRVR